MNPEPKRYVHLARCKDRNGIVAKLSGYLYENGASIAESNHYKDNATNLFYMRTVFVDENAAARPIDVWKDGFDMIARHFDMDWEIHDDSVKPRLLIAVSKFGHCLHDLLHRWKAGLLPVEIAGVVSNHEDMRSFVEWNGLDYHHLPVTKDSRAEQEARIRALVDEHNVDLVVLARYMQILSEEMCRFLAGRCINIHHSFLPSFKGAKPYHQAHMRGVKMIGATAHYVTTDLDEGPIIEQDAMRVSHALTAEQLVNVGRDVECAVLARAVAWHAERRVIMNGQKTVVFATQ
ncbi:formyltetrahydrofolate deformylase [Sphingobium sp. HBC34]|uniref:Formyltetrahydrofolate deformylase n=1 Tax=Sphingobium cyanobacteriorum TaxID=3063954 RepID=A0ABT8ZM29_9SPHN|nr:formyltetrahydrofolate deformylase [Sphingobium sp. HBC34]MDO7835588.1 formyltetrahydrofolate deformylase [Sphingobium sp. HBC34]